ncbi:MAG: hypothetical protein M1826_004519 [Phylliscum demangeonii]|nr:MAG: hypothetical protein M1826_004519 [Phylliscum demangeonii]
MPMAWIREHHPPIRLKSGPERCALVRHVHGVWQADLATASPRVAVTLAQQQCVDEAIGVAMTGGPRQPEMRRAVHALSLALIQQPLPESPFESALMCFTAARAVTSGGWAIIQKIQFSSLTKELKGLSLDDDLNLTVFTTAKTPADKRRTGVGDSNLDGMAGLDAGKVLKTEAVLRKDHRIDNLEPAIVAIEAAAYLTDRFRAIISTPLGTRDPRVRLLETSLGHLMLRVSGIIPGHNTEIEQTTYATFRDGYHQFGEGEHEGAEQVATFA